MATEHRAAGERERIMVRRLFALKQRTEGDSLQQIMDAWNETELGRQFPVTSRSTIGTDLKASLKDLAEESKLEVREVRELLVARLDRAMRAPRFLNRIDKGDLGAIDRLVRMVDRYAKLYGADAPVKVAQTDVLGEKDIATLSDEERAARVRELFALADQRQEATLMLQAPVADDLEIVNEP